ncbi:MAG: hypothetical protein EAX81_03610 [Candidatus Thorarchaeota archaeon]|nr:hypothetical protein [Candidatus Thorarchaeota archaeon]
MTSCIICGRPIQEEHRFCRYHQNAYEELRKMFDRWEKAYGSMQWHDYLEGVLKAEGTGIWVAEVIEAIKKEYVP